MYLLYSYLEPLGSASGAVWLPIRLRLIISMVVSGLYRVYRHVMRESNRVYRLYIYIDPGKYLQNARKPRRRAKKTLGSRYRPYGYIPTYKLHVAT